MTDQYFRKTIPKLLKLYFQKFFEIYLKPPFCVTEISPKISTILINFFNTLHNSILCNSKRKYVIPEC